MVSLCDKTFIIFGKSYNLNLTHFNRFQSTVAFHIETSHLLCLTCSNMKCNTRLKREKNIISRLPERFLLKVETLH